MAELLEPTPISQIILPNNVTHPIKDSYARSHIAFYGTCETAAATAAKVVVCEEFTSANLVEGTVINVKFTNAQTYNGAPTLNVQSTGAKNIRITGNTNAGRYEWVAGEMLQFVYDGTYWVATDGGRASTTYYGVTKLSSATNSTSTALAATASAVKAAYDLANGKQDKLVSGTNIKTINGSSLLGSGDITISGNYLPLTGGDITENNSNLVLALYNQSIEMWDEEGTTYFHVSDLRDTSGIAIIADTFIGDGSTQAFYLNLPASNTNYSVTVNGVEVTSNITKLESGIEFSTAPAAQSEIVVTYPTDSNLTKAYTLGIRDSSSNIGALSVAEGGNITASGMTSHAEGANTIASGVAAHAEGSYTIASGEASHAEGESTTANGSYSHVEGDETIASGEASHAEGKGTTASGIASHAEGSRTTASSNDSHAEGYSTTASGINSHAEGYSTIASKETSHAEGSNTTASGNYSHAQNYYTIATGSSQTALGKYNISDTSNAVIIGNGTSTSARSNALTIDWSGNTWCSGDIEDGSGNVLSNKANIADLATVATSGNYSDLTGIPTIDTTINPTSSNAVENSAVASALSAKANVSSLATVATTGNYSDLNGIPIIDIAIDSTSSNAVKNSAIASALSTKANTADVYTQAQTNTLLANKADASDLTDYLPLTGGTLTGKLDIQNGDMDITTTPSSSQYNGMFEILDSNDKQIMNITAVHTNNGYHGVSMGVYDPDTGQQNTLQLTQNNNNGYVVWISQPAAWRSALSIGTIGTKNTLTASDIPSLDYLPLTGGIIKPGNLVIKDSQDNPYFEVIDLKNNNGGTVTETFEGDGSTTTFYLQYMPVRTDYAPIKDNIEVKINDVSTTDFNVGSTTLLPNSEPDSYLAVIILTSAPTIGDTITVTYPIDDNYHAKSYTLGLRKENSKVGNLSLAEGMNTIASGMFSHAQNYRTTASGVNSHAEGSITIASGFCSHAEGHNTTASSGYSHAEGHTTTASGNTSHAEGYNTTASGPVSHAEGSATTASSDGSHAEGYNTTASNFCSHAQNTGTIAAGNSQTALGKYNISDTTNAVIIGNGTDDSARSNALAIDWNGNVNAAGDITDGSGNVLSDKAGLNVSNNFVGNTQKIQSTNITNNTTVTSDTMGNGRILLTDSDGQGVGWLDPWFYSNGTQAIRLYNRRLMNSTNYYNGFSLGIDSSGNPVTSFYDSDSAKAFRDAIYAPYLSNLSTTAQLFAIRGRVRNSNNTHYGDDCGLLVTNSSFALYNFTDQNTIWTIQGLDNATTLTISTSDPTITAANATASLFRLKKQLDIVTLQVSGLKVVASLAEGSSVALGSGIIPSAYRPVGSSLYIPLTANVSGKGSGCFLYITTAGNVSLYNRSGSALGTGTNLYCNTSWITA